MIIKYFSFLIGVIWSYSIIKTQSVFSKKAGLIFKIFITKVSWFTLIAACYFGYKNFSIKSTIIGIIIAILLVNIGFYFSKKFINQRFDEKKITIFKSFFEYTLIFWVVYYVILKDLVIYFLFLMLLLHHIHQYVDHQKIFVELFFFR